MKIVSLLLSSILSALILFNSFRVSITYAYYELDPIGFIEKLCENKDKPEMQCNGKCHLKKVAESGSKNSQAPEKVINFDELLLYIVNQESFEIIVKTFRKKNTHNYSNLYAYSSSNILDHPPQL